MASGKLDDRCVNETATTEINTNCSQLLHIRDLKFVELFLVDSGAEVSIVKSTATEKNAPSPSLNLVSVNQCRSTPTSPPPPPQSKRKSLCSQVISL